MKKIFSISIVALSIFVACKKNYSNQTLAVVADGANAPVLPAQPFDYSDKVFSSSGSSTNDVIALGRVLFYDKNLSFNNAISCGSCHIQSRGFADNIQFHKGVYGNLLSRNTLAISGDGNNLFWDGRSEDITDLALKPVANHDEMLQDLSKLESKLNQIEYYKKLTKNAFGVEKLDLKKINTAIALFCKTLTPNDNKFLKSGVMPNNLFASNSLSESENNGWQIFAGKGKCSSCHNVFGGNIYNPSFHNTGLDVNYTDNGLSNITNRKNDIGVFKTPNLANVALTAPYMHDGRFKTLEEVVEFYNSGIKQHENLDFMLYNLTDEEIFDIQFSNFNGSSNITDEELIKLLKSRGPMRLNLTSKEKTDLVNFMKTFTDNSLSVDARFSNPFRN